MLGNFGISRRRVVLLSGGAGIYIIIYTIYNKARYQPRSAMRVVHRERKEKITCLKNIHSNAINKNTNQ